ncbi:hypothetical protein SEA_HONK_71 [Microbacterium phage Honk]|uniref:Uncharacterized protein n=1 Tax=Microbacterium phage Honk TaxID=2836095 RepID=A0A8F3INX9_9CAUD|nr:hypothetical protein SEA_HONK_71 [Microbacterium phage Honk]
MPGINLKEASKLLTHVEAQGVKAKRTTKGVMLLLPNGESATFHFTGSDSRGTKNLRAVLKRNGITWPTDTNGDGKHRLHTETLKRGNAAMAELDYPDIVTTGELMGTAAWGGESHGGRSAARNYLVKHLGYELHGATANARYIRPGVSPNGVVEEVAEEPLEALTETAPDAQTPSDATESAEAPEVAPEPSEPQSVAVVAAPEPAAPEPREIIDTRDSWPLDLSAFSDKLTLRELFNTLAQVGLTGEVRVWREPRN